MKFIYLLGFMLSLSACAMEKSADSNSVPQQAADAKVTLGDSVSLIDAVAQYDEKIPQKGEYADCFELLILLEDREMGVKEISPDHILAQIEPEVFATYIFPDNSCDLASAKALAKRLMVKS